MAREFIKANHEDVLESRIRLGDVLSEDHLARFIVTVIGELDLQPIYSRYKEQGGAAYAPEMLLGLLIYGYATGIFSSRKIERNTYESIPFIYIAGGRHPDHDTVNTFRSQFLKELQDVFVQVLLMAQAMGLLKLGNISLDGSKVHADASKSKAVSYKHLLKLEAQLKEEVAALLALADHAEQLPDIDIEHELHIRQRHLSGLSEAKAVLEMRAEARHAQEMAEYEAKMAAREEKTKETGKKPGGRPPQPPTPGPQDKDQYNFTDPESRIMKGGSSRNFDQSYNGQIAVDQGSLFIVGHTLTDHPTDQREALPTVDAIPAALGVPPAAALDAGYFSQANVTGFKARGIEPYIAVGRESHHISWQERMQPLTEPPADAPLSVHMAYKLKTEIGRLIYAARKSTVEPVIGIIKEVLGFRQFSLRGLVKAAGEWLLVCLAYNLKRMHTLATA